MAVKLDNGFILRNPAEKANRYAHQLNTGKVEETGEVLSNTQKAFRSGYLKARSDSAKAWNSNQKKKKSRK